MVDYRNRVIEGVPAPKKEEGKDDAEDENKSENDDEENENSEKEFVVK